MTKTVEPVATVERTRPAETRTERRASATPTSRKDEPTPPTSDPHKGRVIDVMI